MALPAWALLKRDLTATLRGAGAFAMLVVVVGVCIGVVGLLWPEQVFSARGAGWQSRHIFFMFYLANLVAASVLPPGLAALAFSEERRQDTLDQLRLSLVTTGGLVGAKLSAAVAVFVLLFVATLPCLGVQLLTVGISAADVAEFVVATLSTVVMGASIGILCATVFRRSATALTMSYLGTAFVSGGWTIVVLIMAGVLSVIFFAGDLNRGLDAIPGSDLFGEVLEWALAPFVFVLNGGTTSFVNVWSGVTYRLTVASVCVVSAILLTRRSTEPAVARGRKLIKDPAALRARKLRFPFYLIDPLREMPLLPDAANPVLVREWRHGLWRRPQAAFRAFVITALICGTLNLLTVGMAPSVQRIIEEGQRTVLAFEIVILLLIVQMVSAGAFAREREHMSLDFLRASLLSSRSIFWGQFGGGAMAALPYLAGAVAALLVSTTAALLGWGTLPMLLGGLATLLACVWFTLCLSYFVSGFVKSTAAAIGAGVMSNLFVYAWPFVAILWDTITLGGGQRERYDNFFERLSPLVAWLAFRWRTYDNRVHQCSVEGDLYLILAAFVAVGFLLMAWGKWRFDRRNRLSE